MITLLEGKEARAKLARGMKKMADPIAASMGPMGRNFLFEDRDQIHLTKDGATIARYIYGAGLLDRFERAGAALLRRASQKTEEEAGDGTTASTVLAYQMALQAQKHLDEGANIMAIERGMRAAFTEIAKYLETIKRDAKTKDMWERVAYISSRDEEIAGIVARAFEAVGHDGWIRVDKGDDWKEHGMELTLKKGMTFPRGFSHDSAMNDPKFQRCILKDVRILVTDERLYDERHATLLLPIVNALIKDGERALVIIAQNFHGRVNDLIIQCNQMVRSKDPGSLLVLPIECPGMGTEFTEEFCDDIAVLTGSEFISSTRGRSLDRIQIKDLGRCQIVESKRRETTIVNEDESLKEKIDLRVAEIRSRAEKAEGELEKTRMLQRVSALTCGSALIIVGGRNVENIGEKSARVEDAVLAAKAAHEEGIVPGGGMALLLAGREIKMKKPADADEALGVQIVWEALETPMRTIAKNCTLDPDEVVAQAETLKDFQTMNMNSGRAETVDAFDEGVVDPLKSVRQALLNAIEAALVYIGTETVGVMIQEDRLGRPIFETLQGDAALVSRTGAGSDKPVCHPNEIPNE